MNVSQQVAQQGNVLTMVVLSLVMAGVVGIIYGMFRLLSTRRASRGGGGGERERSPNRGAGRDRDRADRMPKNALRDVWTRFMRAQPRPHRRSIRDYPMVLVLGPAGGGKSQLVDAQVDWQAQQKRFLPSLTDDPLLQIYIGSRVVVQEVSAALLADDSADARRALKRLWARSTRVRPPGVIVVLDAVALSNAAPEELRRQAQLVRGKIDLLQEIHRRPLRISVCLTHLDRFAGFAELAEVSTRHRLPLVADLRNIAAMRDSRDVQIFGAREDHLNAALTASPAESFSRVVELLSSSGGLGPPLGAFLAPLGGKSRLAAPPELDKLYFFAPGAESDRAIDRAIVAPAPKAQARKIMRRNIWRLAVVGGLASLYLGFAHYNHARKLAAATAAVASYEAACKPGATAANELDRSLDRADATMRAVQSAERWWPLLKLSARDDKRRMAATTVSCTRGAYLLPIAAHGAVESRELAVYLLGLLYAASDNALGDWIAPRAAAWATNLKVPERAVSAYIYWSPHAWGDPLALQLPIADNDPALSFKPWLEFFVRLQAAYDSQDVGEELVPLQTRAAQLAEAIDRSHKFPEVSTVMTLLPPIAPFDVATLLKAPKRDEAITWIEQNRPALEGVLAMVQDGDLAPAVLGRMTLVALLAHVNKIMGGPSSEVYAFKLEKKYSFGRQRWQEMIARASVQIYVKQPGYPFWPRETQQAQPKPEAVIDATQRDNGSDAPQKEAVIDATQLASAPPPKPAPPPTVVDPYHKATVDGMVRPVIDEFGKKLPSSPLPVTDRETLASYALAAANDYAQRYREALYASYQPFHLAVKNAAELPPAINAMIKPNGGFMRWLRSLAEDADLQNLDSPYLRSLSDAVAPLQPIVRLVHPKDATAGELAKYVALVTKLSRELAGTERTAPTGATANTAVFSQPPTQQFGVPTAADPASGGGGGGDELSRLLSPVARVAMGMLLQPETSYTAQTLQWLAEVGITDELRLPFLEPFERVLDFGVPELERGLQKQWVRTWGIVGKTFEKYPFRRKAKREVEPSEIDAFKEGGAFWQSFRDLAQFCVLRSTGWAQRGPLARPLNLPAGMLGRVNMIVGLARVYFDKDGKRQPLALTVTPLPLPKELDREGYVTMSFLRGGGAAVFGFNQAPTARSFTPSWWGADGSSIGIMFGDPVLRNQSDRSPDQQLDTPASPWALYHLLERAQQVGDTYIWTMPREFSLPRDGKRRTVQIRFVMRGADIALHPWTQFGKE